MHKYIYDGPLMFFGRYTGDFHGETMAETEKKAINNLLYQVKTKNNRLASAGGFALVPKHLKQIS